MNNHLMSIQIKKMKQEKNNHVQLLWITVMKSHSNNQIYVREDTQM
jgi:hypothetical protein